MRVCWRSIMGLKDEIENARRTHDIRDVLGTQKKYIVCPLPLHIHRRNTPSFMIFFRDGVQYFRCHGNCGLTGDVIDLVGYLRVPGYDRKDGKMVREAMAILENRFEARLSSRRNRPRFGSSFFYPGSRPSSTSPNGVSPQKRCTASAGRARAGALSNQRRRPAGSRSGLARDRWICCGGTRNGRNLSALWLGSAGRTST